MSASSKRLEGRVAIVTGAGQGIGEGIARGYARESAKVIITGRTMSKLDEVAGKIRADGGEVLPLEALAGDRQHAERTVAEAIARWGRVDVLVNNAHTFTDYLPVEDPKMEEHILINMQSAFIGSLQLMQFCFPHMRDAGGGSIINMGTDYGIRCEPGFLAYASSKESIRTLTKTAAKEMGQAQDPGEHHPALCALAQGDLVPRGEQVLRLRAVESRPGLLRHARRHRSSGDLPRQRRFQLHHRPDHRRRRRRHHALILPPPQPASLRPQGRLLRVRLFHRLFLTRGPTIYAALLVRVNAPALNRAARFSLIGRGRGVGPYW